MPRNKTAFARKIIDFFTERDIDCTIVDDHQKYRITISVDGKTREFSYGSRDFSRFQNPRTFYMALESELAQLRAAPAEPAKRIRDHARMRSRKVKDAGEEALQTA